MFPNETDSEEELEWDKFGCPVRLDLANLADTYGHGEHVLHSSCHRACTPVWLADMTVLLQDARAYTTGLLTKHRPWQVVLQQGCVVSGMGLSHDGVVPGQHQHCHC